MNNYIYLQLRDIKIPLLAQNGTWDFVLNGTQWSICEELERMYAYYIGMSYYTEAAGTLRANNKYITTVEIDEFINYFQETHEFIKESIDVKNTPLYATPEKPLYLPNPFSYTVTLSCRQEKELMDIIAKRLPNTTQVLVQWFNNYVAKYDLHPRYKRDIPIQGEELATLFCAQHGMNLRWLEVAPDPNWVAPRKREPISKARHICNVLMYLTLNIVLFFAAGLLMASTCLDVLPLSEQGEITQYTAGLYIGTLIIMAFLMCYIFIHNKFRWSMDGARALKASAIATIVAGLLSIVFAILVFPIVMIFL